MLNWDFFSVQNTAFSILNYPVSYLELIGVITGYTTVLMATKMHKFFWWISFINVLAFAYLFYQIQLYADAFLQIYYLGITVYGLIQWYQSSAENLIKPKQLNTSQWINIVAFSITLWLISYYIFSNLNHWLPLIFPLPTSFVILETLILTLSIIANWLLAERYKENWIFWLLVNIMAVYVYYQKEIYFTCLQYFIFGLMAVYGYLEWQKAEQQVSDH